MAFTPQDLLHTAGAENIPGTAQMFYYAEWDKITAWPAAGSTTATRTLLTGSFTFSTGGRWYKWYNTLETGEITSKMEGETDCKSFQNRVEFKHPGSSVAFMGVLAELKNRNIVVVAIEGNGQMRMIGNWLFGAAVEDGSETSGKKGTEYKGFNMAIKARYTDPCPVLDPAVVLSLVAAS